MKIALINLPLDTNYGGSLQRFALCKILTEMGHQVTYLPIIVEGGRKQSGILLFLGKAKRYIYKILNREILVCGIPVEQFEKEKTSELKRQLPIFLDFAQKYLHCYSKSFRDFSEIEEVVEMFDAFVVGSDQVWRAYNKKDLPHYYLDFVPASKRKVAYAASFGNSGQNYDGHLVDLCGRLVKEFYSISFREQAGLDAVHKFSWSIHPDPKIVLDPTLLIDAEGYRSIFDLKVNLKDKRLFYYVLDKTENVNTFIKSWSDKIGLLNYGIDSLLPNIGKGTSTLLPSPVEWISSIYNADFIITDSFHGTLFSIIMNKPFITIMNPKRGISRYQPLMDKLGLSNRIVSVQVLNELSEESFSDIDWISVNAKLGELKKQSLCFLREALS